jgi:hypothetical protein
MNWYKKATRDRNSKILYYVGPGPAQPNPPKHGGWSRRDKEYGKQEKVFFLTPDYCTVWTNHGRRGNVYIYEVPNWVIKESGGVQRYDNAAEVIIPASLFVEVKMIGSIDEQKVNDKCRHRLNNYVKRMDLFDKSEPEEKVDVGSFVHWMNASEKGMPKETIFKVDNIKGGMIEISVVGALQFSYRYDDNGRMMRKWNIQKGEGKYTSKQQSVYPISKKTQSQLAEV